MLLHRLDSLRYEGRGEVCRIRANELVFSYPARSGQCRLDILAVQVTVDTEGGAAFINQLSESGWFMKRIGRRVMQRDDQDIVLILAAAQRAERRPQPAYFAFVDLPVLLLKLCVIGTNPPTCTRYRYTIHYC